MKTPLLALLAAATVALAATTSTNTNKKPSGPTPPGGNKTATAEKAEKKPKKDAKAEAPAAAPVAAAEPASLVVQTVDATTQMALNAAKAAQEEVAKLTAIGTGKAAGGASNAKLAEAVVGTGVVVANDASLQRANLLTHQTKRSNSPALIVTNHQAQKFPTLYPTEDAGGSSKREPYRFDRILAETRGKVGVITLNRPKALNALNVALTDELGAALRALADHRWRDRPEVFRWSDPMPFVAELSRWIRGR